MAVTYTVTNQTPVKDTVAGHGFVDAMEITFTTKPSGVTGRVRIPMTSYHPDHVDTVLAAQARLLEDVQNL